MGNVREAGKASEGRAEEGVRELTLRPREDTENVAIIHEENENRG